MSDDLFQHIAVFQFFSLSVKITGRIILPVFLVSFFVVTQIYAFESNSFFLQSLTGDWIGKAIHTPVGPIPYDINFQYSNENCNSGIANNNFSNHYWMFCDSSGNLSLEFMSDFRGNNRSIFLQLISQDKNVFVFRADTHQFMDVVVKPRKDQLHIKIMHYGKLHVAIELQRNPA